MTTERLIKSDAARRDFRHVLDGAEKGVFAGISRWNDPPTAWLVSDEWYQRAQKCLTAPPGAHRRQAGETLRHFRAVLDDAEKGIFTGIGRWNDPPTVWVISEEWYRLAQACLADKDAGESRRQAEQHEGNNHDGKRQHP